eukprot:TRINITY_DN2524_c0_g1_i1.p1 TRINITY_DN2524_c0_g1~~TRINITY_DN2524_c0_g1_i1.p1  ORF type:complete len:127 (-),score=7.50 TRINITY_DN2524_c0_g1_i1:173-553(-)
MSLPPRGSGSGSEPLNHALLCANCYEPATQGCFECPAQKDHFCDECADFLHKRFIHVRLPLKDHFCDECVYSNSGNININGVRISHNTNAVIAGGITTNSLVSGCTTSNIVAANNLCFANPIAAGC